MAQLAYDNRSRVSAAANPAGSMTFGYDASGNLTKREYSEGAVLQYAYGKRRQLTAADNLSLEYDARAQIVKSNGLEIGRDDAGRIASIAYAPDKTVRYTYDSRGLVATVTDWVGGVTELGYNAARQLVSIARPNGVVTRFDYDNEGRVSSIWDVGFASHNLTRDAAGRIAAADRSLPLTPDPAEEEQQFAYDAAHQVAGASYDGMGRLVSDGARQFRWDLASRLTAYTAGSPELGYDGLGMLVRRNDRTYAQNYAFALPQIAVERQADADLRYYIHLPNGGMLHSIAAWPTMPGASITTTNRATRPCSPTTAAP